MNVTRLDWLYASSAAVALGAAGAALFLRKHRRQDPEVIERRRREYVARVGRISQAEILEVLESAGAPLLARRRAFFGLRGSAAAPLPRPLVLYRYTVSGVTYETAQDFSDLAAALGLAAGGELAFVKYDPADPSNSVLATEHWSGLHSPDASVAARKKGS